MWIESYFAYFMKIVEIKRWFDNSTIKYNNSTFAVNILAEGLECIIGEKIIWVRCRNIEINWLKVQVYFVK